MKITRLKATKNNLRVSIYIDGEFELAVERNQIIDSNLFVGKEITKDQLEDLKKKDLVSRYFKRALGLLSRRPRSVFEVRKYLNSKRIQKELVDDILKKLISNDYLNDKKFASWWVENRVQFKPRGRYLIEKELHGKGVERDIVTEALSESDIEEKEFDLALELAKKKKRVIGDIKGVKNKRKLLSFLIRKGFSYSIAKEIYNCLK